VVALVAAGSAACGTAQAGTTPQDKVGNAFTKLGDQKSLTLGASLDATADQIYAVLKGDDFTHDTASALAALHATFSVAADKPLSQATDDDSGSYGFQLSSDAAGKQNLAEVRSVDQQLYLRFDLKALQKLAPDTSGDGGSGTSLADLNELLDSVDQLPSSAGALKAAVDGEWISVDPATLTSFAQTFGDLTGSGSSSGSGLDAQSTQQLVTAFEDALTHNAKFTDLGSSGGADHVQVSVPAQQFAGELKTSLASVAGDLPGFDAADLDGLDDVPNRTVTADVAIKDGSVSGITFDLAQLDDQPHTGKLPLALTLRGGSDPVTAPAGAQKFDPQDLLGVIMGGLPGSLTGDDPSSTDLGSTDTGSSTASPGSGDDGTDTGYFAYTPL